MDRGTIAALTVACASVIASIAFQRLLSLSAHLQRAPKSMKCKRPSVFNCQPNSASHFGGIMGRTILRAATAFVARAYLPVQNRLSKPGEWLLIWIKAFDNKILIGTPMIMENGGIARHLASGSCTTS